MSRRHRNVVTLGNGVTFFGKASRRQELLRREVRKLYDRGTVGIDKGKQCGTCREHHFYWIFEPPSLVKFWNRSSLEIKCDNLRQFLDTQWPGSHRNA